MVDRSDDGRRIYLDRTAFYPTSGGQPFDTGLLGGIESSTWWTRTSAWPTRSPSRWAAGPPGARCIGIAWSRGRGHRERTAKRRAQSRADAGDLVLGLECAHAEALVLGQLVQDVRGGGDRVGAQEERQAGPQRGRDQPVGQRQVPGDVAVLPARQRRRLHLIGDREGFGRLAEVVPGLERGRVGGRDIGLVGELGRDEVERALGRP